MAKPGERYFRNLYQRTMAEAYSAAREKIVEALRGGGDCLDCGAGEGQGYNFIHERINLDRTCYYALDWNVECVNAGQGKGLQIVQADINHRLPFPSNRFQCVFALSVLEHLFRPCGYLQEAYRVLKEDGTLVLLTPNISTYFTALLILLGRMPSTGPHPDSDGLLCSQEIFKVSADSLHPDAEQATPMHRHLVVFSFRVLKQYLRMVGFRDVRGQGFGLYPFPNFLQPVLEKIDPYHCHQMVFAARK